MSNVKKIGLTIVLATVFNLLIYVIANGQGVSLLANLPGVSGESKVPLLYVVLASVVTAVGAGFSYLLLEKASDTPKETFLWIAAVVGFLSLLPGLTSLADRPTYWALGLMHIVSTLFTTYFFAVYE